MGLRGGMKQAWADASAGDAPAGPGPRQSVEYDVVEVRERMLSMASAPTDALRRLLNERARDGWVMRALVSAEVAGTVTKRDGWMLVLERPV